LEEGFVGSPTTSWGIQRWCPWALNFLQKGGPNILLSSGFKGAIFFRKKDLAWTRNQEYRIHRFEMGPPV